MTLDEAIKQQRDGVGQTETEALLQSLDDNNQIADWLEELKEKRIILNDYKKILPLIKAGMDKFMTEWEPYNKELLFPYEASLLMSYENISKLVDSIEKSTIDK